MRISSSSFNDDFNDWAFDPARKAGDTEIIEKDDGYEIVYFVSNNKDDLDQYDGPSDSTISRWKRKIRELCRKRLTASGSLPKKYHFSYEQILDLYGPCASQTTLIMDHARSPI